MDRSSDLHGCRLVQVKEEGQPAGGDSRESWKDPCWVLRHAARTKPSRAAAACGEGYENAPDRQPRRTPPQIPIEADKEAAMHID
jgi:hypothetical protein